MQLTEQQINHFKTFGFLVFRQLLTPEEVQRYSDEFDAGMDATIEGGMHNGIDRHWAPLMDSNTPFITSLLDDHRFADVTEQLLESEVLGAITDGNYRVGDTSWHPDQAALDYTGVKFTIYTDPLTASTGALRVIPGSHREPLHSAIAGVESLDADGGGRSDPQTVFGIRPEELPAYAFESEPGDVLVFNLATWHSAFGGSTHRRMGTICLMADPQTPKEKAAIRNVYKRHVERHYMPVYSGQHWPEYWRSIDDPRHQRWVRRLDELGVLETPPSTGAGATA